MIYSTKTKALSASVCLMLSFYGLILGIFEPNSGVLLSTAIGTYCVMRARIDYFPVLFVCNLNSFDLEFVRSYAEVSKSSVLSTLSISDRFLPTFSEVSALLVGAFMFFLLLFGRLRVGDRSLKLIFGLWVVCVLGGLINTIFSLIAGNEMWTRGLRAVLTVGIYFYGFHVARRSSTIHEIWCYRAFLFLILAIGVLIFAHMFWSHMLFWLVSLVAVVLVWRKIHGIFLIVLYSPVIFGSSLTMMLIPFVSLLAGLAQTSKKAAAKIVAAKTFLYLILAGPFLSLGLGIGAASLGISADVAMVSTDAALGERAWFKFAADRIPLWASAAKQIFNGDLIFPTSGRPLYTMHFGKDVTWQYGAHNTYLEILRNNGLLFGGLLLLIVFQLTRRVVIQAVRVYTLNRYSLFAASAVAMMSVGFLLGDFIVEPTVGLPFWGMFGFVAGRIGMSSWNTVGNTGA